MPAETYVNVGGAYHQVRSDMYVNVGGGWHNCNFAYLNVGGVWKTVFVRDTDPPPVPAPYAETGLGYNVLVTIGAHADAVTGTVASHVDASYNGGAWQTIYNIPSPGSWTSFVDNIAARGVRGQTCVYRLYAVDALGNAAYSGNSNTYQSRPLGGAILFAQESITYDESVGWTANPRLISGAYGGHQNHGFWFYGDQIATFLRGWMPDRVYLLAQKVSGLSAAGIVYICPHNLGYRSAVPYEYTDYVDGGDYLAVDPVNYSLNPSWFAGFVDGSFKGVATIPYASQPFKALYGINEDGYSGALTVYFDS
jgi:hypothetical protein